MSKAVEPGNYFRKGFGLKADIEGDLAADYSGQIVDYLPPLRATADFLEIDWRHGKPVFTTNRYGVGYERNR